MKKTLVLSTVMLVSGFAFAVLVQLAGYVSFNAPDVFAVLGGFAGCGVVLVAFGDYARKPRLTIGDARDAAPQTATRATTPEIEEASSWAYRTYSA